MKRALMLISLITCISLFGATGGAPPDSQPMNISLPPIATFKDYCARCHGYEGSAYGRDFGSIRDDSLKQITEDMMFGPAGLNPDSISIAAMVAYNRALSRKVPFAAVLNARSYFDKRDSLLSIEASPGALVESADSLKLGNNGAILWRMPLNRNGRKSIRITVTRKGIASIFQFPGELWSR